MTSVVLEFSGGLELLVDGKKRLEQEVPDKLTLGGLIGWIRSNLIKERHELFSQGQKIRPGVLVLINDIDWELEGKETYNLSSGDCISFISTLHGG
mmetsp:Transcript_13899/g.56027  ORF Transcript_13899/g.56027 Transcript_13899/m.56027 type:complete len:96 (-) Transcript_13899:354-641(-)